MIKKISKLVLILFLLFSITGCSGKNDSQNATTDIAESYSDTYLQSENLTEPPSETSTKTQTDETAQETIPQLETIPETEPETFASTSMEKIPSYSGKPYVAVNGNIPYFNLSEKNTKVFEKYSETDELGRCGVAYANICKELMPTEEREAIGMIKPSGWQTLKFDFVDGKYLYNRCHLIGFQLAGENANYKNLITGTRYFNVKGMLPFENMVADYVKESGNHVLYRVTPYYKNSNLVADGVLMEAYSVEDEGEGICFNVFVFNVQPGVKINYANGNAVAEGGDTTPTKESTTQGNTQKQESVSYILNTNSKLFHLSGCSSVKRMKESNKKTFSGTRDEVINMGYTACKKCNP